VRNLKMLSVCVPAAGLIENIPEYCGELLAIRTVDNAFDAL